MKPKLVSNASVFAKLGNPWVSERDRNRDYPNEPSENPDMDQWTQASKASPRHERGPEKAGQVLCDSHRKKAMALHRMNSAAIKSRHSRLLIK